MKRVTTRFRAYKLNQKGSLCSYFDGHKFTLIESILTEESAYNLGCEIMICKGVLSIDDLLISSWDTDHCNYNSLEAVLKVLRPGVIYLPGYYPESDEGKACLSLVTEYLGKISVVSSQYISTLSPATYRTKNNILYDIGADCYSNNDKSTKVLFRTGDFNVAYFGDVESIAISEEMLTLPSIRNEIDILILPHHGADNGFTSTQFLKAVQPSLSIACSNYNNQYGHTDNNIINRLSRLNLKYASTKSNDLLIESISSATFEVIDFNTNSEYFYTKNFLSNIKSSNLLQAYSA